LLKHNLIHVASFSILCSSAIPLILQYILIRIVQYPFTKVTLTRLFHSGAKVATGRFTTGFSISKSNRDQSLVYTHNHCYTKNFSSTSTTNSTTTTKTMSSAIVSMLGEKLLSKSGLVSTSEVLKDKLVALYFSAHWCPPCRAFTPQFATVFESMQSHGKPFQVVFVSADQDTDAFTEYFGQQPWLAIPYDDQDTRDKLNETFGIRGIPALYVLDTNGKIITKEGRQDVMKLKENAFDTWEQKAKAAA